jgi:hypothetical protein
MADFTVKLDVTGGKIVYSAVDGSGNSVSADPLYVSPGDTVNWVVKGNSPTHHGVILFTNNTPLVVSHTNNNPVLAVHGSGTISSTISATPPSPPSPIYKYSLAVFDGAAPHPLSYTADPKIIVGKVGIKAIEVELMRVETTLEGVRTDLQAVGSELKDVQQAVKKLSPRNQ